MQALSFAICIPLVCLGSPFGRRVCFVESPYLRTGDAPHRTLAAAGQGTVACSPRVW